MGRAPLRRYCIGHCCPGSGCNLSCHYTTVAGTVDSPYFRIRLGGKSAWAVPTRLGRERLERLRTAPGTSTPQFVMCQKTTYKRYEEANTIAKFFTLDHSVDPPSVPGAVGPTSVATLQVRGQNGVYRVGWASGVDGAVEVSTRDEYDRARAYMSAHHPGACAHYHVRHGSPLFVSVTGRLQRAHDAFAAHDRVTLPRDDLVVVFVSTLPDKKCKTLGEGRDVADSGDAWTVPRDHRTTFFMAATEDPTFEDILAVAGPSQLESVYLHEQVRPAAGRLLPRCSGPGAPPTVDTRPCRRWPSLPRSRTVARTGPLDGARIHGAM